MSIIAWDSNEVVSDGMICSEYQIVGLEATKVFALDLPPLRRHYTWMPHRLYAAAVGDAAECWAAIRAISEDEHPIDEVRDKYKDAQISLIGENGWSQFSANDIQRGPHAIGIGAEFAMGLMTAGHSPYGAVKETVKHFQFIGGKIQRHPIEYLNASNKKFIANVPR